VTGSDMGSRAARVGFDCDDFAIQKAPVIHRTHHDRVESAVCERTGTMLGCDDIPVALAGLSLI
jgi:hypothetical protein